MIWPVKDSLYSPEYKKVLVRLIELRAQAGLSQRDLAKKLKREHSFVWRIETGRRRLDIVEFLWLCQTIGQDAVAVYRKIVQDITR